MSEQQNSDNLVPQPRLYTPVPDRSSAELDRMPEGAESTSCLCSQTLQPGDQVRWMETKTDAPFPPVPFPSRQLYAEVGQECLTALVEQHHERLKRSEIGGMFPSDPSRFAATVAKSAQFVIEASGGPELFTPVFGGMRMRDRHFRPTIDEHARDVWLHELMNTFDEVDFPQQWRPVYWHWMEAFSIRMINRRTRMQPPRRYPYEFAASDLRNLLGVVG